MFLKGRSRRRGSRITPGPFGVFPLWSYGHGPLSGSRNTIRKVAIGPRSSDRSHQLRPLLPLPWANPALIKLSVSHPTEYPPTESDIGRFWHAGSDSSPDAYACIERLRDPRTKASQGPGKPKRVVSHTARWTVGTREKSSTFRTKALAENYLSDRRQAAKRGEAFDLETGLPESMLKAKNARTWYAFAVAYVETRRPGLTRRPPSPEIAAALTGSGFTASDRVGGCEACPLRASKDHSADHPDLGVRSCPRFLGGLCR